MTCHSHTCCHMIRWYIRFTIQLLYLIGHHIWMMLGLVWLQEHTPKGYVLKRHWTTCSKYKTIVGSILSPVGIHCQHNIILLVDNMVLFFKLFIIFYTWSKQSFGMMLCLVDVSWPFPTPHTILAIGIVWLEFVIDVLSNYCETRRLTFTVSTLQVLIQELNNINFKISMFVCNNQAITIK